MLAGQVAPAPNTKSRPGGRTERNRQAVADAVLSCVREGRLDFEIQEIAALSSVHRTTLSRRSKVSAAVEHVFAGQKHRMGLVVRTIDIARVRIKIGMANLVYNFQRLAWLERRTAPT